jgi:decaprenyl-phosphate phosphoribosyltransferase
MSTDAQVAEARPTLRGHIEILRIDHWFKNVFILPGIAVALTVEPEPGKVLASRIGAIVLGIFATCLIASSNYTINEILDAVHDRHHPTKHTRPTAAGRVNVPLGYVQWIAVMIAGLAIASLVSWQLAVVLGVLWVMGCIYNIRPVRSKDVPYVDVLSESVNNPLRMLAGWYIIGPAAVPPVSLLMSYWMVGAFFMAMKRFAELRFIGDRVTAATYRKSFAYYTEDRLMTSIMFYASGAMLFFGAFIMRYRLELLLGIPFVALVMAAYTRLGLKPDSPVQRPEELYRQPHLMLTVGVCAAVLLACLFVDVPILDKVFAPTMPTRSTGHP